MNIAVDMLAEGAAEVEKLLDRAGSALGDAIVAVRHQVAKAPSRLPPPEEVNRRGGGVVMFGASSVRLEE